jgi:hypothetical protein
MMKRVLGAAGVGVLVSCLGALAACGTPSADEENAKSGAAALKSANVSIDIFDANGTKVGEGAGVLIAPNAVLTSGHLVAGKAKWTITTADGKTTVNGTRGLTKDWMQYDSMKAHPRKTDVGVIYLDKAIHLDAYPKLATTKSSSGTPVTRVSHARGNFDMIGSSVANVRNFPHAYVADMPNSETVNTGGAVINGKGEIVGIVTGRGMQTSKMYIARTDGLAQWLAPKIVCAGGKADGLGIRTYGAPPPKPGCDAGTGTSSSGSSGASSGSSGASSGSSGASSGSSGASSGSSGASSGSSGASSGSSGSSGSDGVPSNCDDGGGNVWGGPPGGGSSSGSSGSSGSDGTTPGSSSGSSGASSGTPGSSGSSGAAGTTPGSSSGTSGTPGASSGTPGSSGSSGAVGTTPGSSSGTSGTPGASSGTPGSSGSSGSDTLPPGSSSGGGGGGGTGDEEVCEGPSDNPDECPPEDIGCTGPSCGGASSPDSTIDYGNCACSSSVASGTLPVIR